MPEILNIERLRDPELDKLARSTDLEGALLAVKHLERRASPLRDKAFDDLLRARTTAPKVRRTIATICGKRATPQNHALLGLALADPDGVVVRNAAKAIGQIGTLAELTRLEALPRQAAEVQASVDFAKSLLSYRHRLGKYRQPVPAAASIVGLRGGFELAAGSVDASKSALAEATRDLPGIGLAAHGGALLECHGVKILIAFTDAFPDPGAIGSLGSRDARPLVIMHAGLSVDRFVLSQHIVTHPGENGAIELLGLRPGGADRHQSEQAEPRANVSKASYHHAASRVATRWGGLAGRGLWRGASAGERPRQRQSLYLPASGGVKTRQTIRDNKVQQRIVRKLRSLTVAARLRFELLNFQLLLLVDVPRNR
ncbi:MAG TPA: hypothetical protein PKW35_08270, partial [Nannocystaceae bacterium]|nr:hypothetical protein [Nannocystaceae bacterium]